jgi:DGQHR domain-containing protein
MFSASDRRALRLTFDVTHIPPRIPPKTMPELTRPAARIRQGNLIIYATSLQVRDLREPNFYKIDTLDADEGTGYQRLLNETRAKRLADYLLDGHKALEAFLPTSIFLATDKLVPFDEKSNTVRIDPDKIGAFNVVDGQHRIRGLVLAAEKDPTLNEFEVPVNIAVNLSPISQMAHFLIVNTTQRSVDKAIEQQIVARLTQMIEFEKTPVLPKWIQRQVDKGEDSRAIQIVQFLNDEKESPWYGKIRMANDDDSAGDATINQKSFVASLKKYILTPSNPIAGDQWSTDKQRKVLMNYWRAIRNLLVEDDDDTSVIFKTNGLHMFHSASPALFLHLANLKDFKTETVEKLLAQAFENLSTEYIGVSSPGFWKRGATASGLNQAAIRKFATALSTAVHSQPGSSDGFSM